ncbi:MAG TPA: DUF5655 domain-containing protein [Gemmatimonadaceae bacterium]|nr:DUF5655 domain-containing protein [Gemmatimonadaceae bacterium]
MSKRALWTCPECGQRFVTRNMSHSCGSHTIAEHFTGKPASIRTVFDALKRATREHGAFHVYAQKTRIVFQTRARFVSVVPRKSHLGGHVWLKRKRPHPAVHRIEGLAGRDFVHNFRLTSPSDIDDAFRDLLAEAYAVGSQSYRARGLEG